MAENRYSGSVDEIMENVKRRQAGASAASDSEVDAILASLGLGPATGTPEKEQEAAPRQEEPEIAPEPVREEPVRPEEAEELTESGEEETAETHLEDAVQEKDPQEQSTDEICLDFVRAGLEKKQKEEEPARQSAPVQEPESQPEPEEDDDASELRRRFEKAAARSVGMDGESDGSFVDFFSDHVAVIPDEEEELPSLFSRFIKKRKKEEFAEAAQDPDIMMPGVSEPDPAADEPTGEIRLNVDLQDETGQIDTRLVAEAMEAGRNKKEEQEQEEEPTRELPGGREEPRKKIRLFGRGEPAQPFEEEEPEEQEETAPDYESLEDAPAVKADLAAAYAKATLAVTISGIAAAALLYLGVSAAGALPAVLDPVQLPQAFLGVELVLLLAAAGVCLPWVKEGFAGFGKGKPSPNTMPALAFALCVLQLAVCLLMAESFDAAGMTLYAPVAALLLCGNAAGHWIETKVVKENFEMITAGMDHSAAYRLQNVELTSLLAEGLEEERPALLVSRPTSLIKGFLRKSMSRPASDANLQKLARTLAAAAAIAALVTCLRSRDALQAVSVLAAVFCLGTPVCTTLFTALCGQLQQKGSAKVGAVVPGWAAVEELGCVNTIVVEAKDLFPRGSVILQGIKTFERERIDLAILYAASVLVEGCDTLRDVFLNIIQNKTEMLYPVENLVNERGRGFTAWINGSRVILGNRNMMTAHDIDIPSLDYENRYTKGEKQPVYLAVSGKLFGMFVVDYRAGRETASVLRTLQQSGISLLVRSDDFSVTSALTERVYRLRKGSVKVLTAQEMDHLATATGYLPESEGCMMHLGSFASYVGGMRSAASAAAAQQSSCTVLSASVVLGALLGLLLSVTGGLLDLALPAVVLYHIAWAVPTLALPLVKKYK